MPLSIPSAPIATPGACSSASSRSENVKRSPKSSDLTASEVSAFLGHAEHDRKGTIGTRNCRLAAIRSFFHFVAGKEPTAIAQCTEVIAVPIKRASIKAPCYLEPREVEAILAQPARARAGI
jgi:site-specific recombinase XerD